MIIFDFFYMKNLKSQITLIIKYSVHAFKCAKNLIIMSLLLLYELSLKIFIECMFFVVIYMCLIIYYFR